MLAYSLIRLHYTSLAHSSSSFSVPNLLNHCSVFPFHFFFSSLAFALRASSSRFFLRIFVLYSDVYVYRVKMWYYSRSVTTHELCCGMCLFGFASSFVSNGALCSVPLHSAARTHTQTHQHSIVTCLSPLDCGSYTVSTPT